MRADEARRDLDRRRRGRCATMRMPLALASTRSSATMSASVAPTLRANAQHLALRGGGELHAERVVDVHHGEAGLAAS